ncbi:MAG TPA: choice-of-anchor D domain-containing protein, partial [Candidatus Baltobacteraceae bacterium]|nr:choice-of-anchor D domain-containing protein [Candidatus Baltobacteraceae bacterium]
MSNIAAYGFLYNPAGGAALTASPAPLAFGNQTQNTTSAPMNLMFSNSGTATLAITALDLSGANAGDFAQVAAGGTCGGLPITILAGGNCTVQYTFTPATTSGESAMLTITDNAADSPQSVTFTGTGTPAGGGAGPATFLGPIPYLSRADSPFLADILAGKTYIETFEAATVQVPGATLNCNIITPSGITDSVDADDGTLDGFGTSGQSCFNGSGSTGVTVTFNATALGAFPTQAGIVWTDGGGTTTFQAFDPSGNSLGTVGPVSIADGSIGGTTGEDNFFGVMSAGGIGSIVISNASGGIEVDHLQFGNYTSTGGVTATTGSLAFASTAVGGSSATQPVTFTNTGASALPVAQMTATGDFSQTNNCGS